MTKETFEKLRKEIYQVLEDEWIAIGQDIMFQYEEYGTIEIGEDIRISLNGIEQAKTFLKKLEEIQEQEEKEVQ